MRWPNALFWKQFAGIACEILPANSTVPSIAIKLLFDVIAPLSCMAAAVMVKFEPLAILRSFAAAAAVITGL